MDILKSYFSWSWCCKTLGLIFSWFGVLINLMRHRNPTINYLLNAITRYCLQNVSLEYSIRRGSQFQSTLWLWNSDSFVQEWICFQVFEGQSQYVDVIKNVEMIYLIIGVSSNIDIRRCTIESTKIEKYFSVHSDWWDHNINVRNILSFVMH